MVKHVVMWKLTPGYDRTETVKAIRAEAQRLLCPIEGVLRLEVWEGYQSKEVDHAAALYIEFMDRMAEQRYLAHPNHLAFKEFIAGKVTQRVAIDSDEY